MRKRNVGTEVANTSTQRDAVASGARNTGKRARPYVPFVIERQAVEFNLSIRLDLNEVTQKMNGPQIEALMSGIALVLNVDQQ